jgi:hypothetical protein
MPGQVVGIKAFGYTQSKRRFPAFLEGFPAGGTSSLIAAVQAAVGSNANRFMFQDFHNTLAGNMSPYSNTVANGGSLVDSTAFVDHITKAVGVASIGTGTTNAAGMSGLSTAVSSLTLGTRAFAFEARITGSTSTGAQEYSIIAGFGSNFLLSALNAVNCAYFRYHRAVDGTKWACITAKDSDADPTNPTNTTKHVTTVDFDPNDMHVFRIECTTAGVVTFFIDGVQVHQTSQNVPTDPAGFGHQVATGARVLKNNGTGTARSCFVDYMSLVAA